MKTYPYLLFAGDTYYPNGGLEDFIDRFETIEEAKIEALKSHNYSDMSGTWIFDWWHIVDVNTLTIVATSKI